MSYFGAKDFMLEMAKGNIPGHSYINKFGDNEDVAKDTTEDIWSNGSTYSFPATAIITHIKQSVNDGTMAGKVVEVQGLDASWNLTVQNATLHAVDTTTQVTLTTPLIRAFRMRVLANVVAAQDIVVVKDGGATTYAIIKAGDNQTMMAIYTIPNGKTGYMTSYYGDYVRDAIKDPDSVDFKDRCEDVCLCG